MTVLKNGDDPAVALRNTTFIGAGLFWLGGYGVISQGLIDVEMGIMHSVVLGSIVGILIGLVTEYYTGIEPVMGLKTKAIPHIGEMSKTGPATNAIAGLSVGYSGPINSVARPTGFTASPWPPWVCLPRLV